MLMKKKLNTKKVVPQGWPERYLGKEYCSGVIEHLSLNWRGWSDHKGTIRPSFKSLNMGVYIKDEWAHM